VCVGGLTKNKGQDLLIAALARLRAGGSTLHAVFVGDGPERHALEDLADQVGVRSDCTFTGSLDRHEVLELMSRSLVTVVPSRSEAFGIVAIESMALGTPVIASAVDGLKEVVGPGVGFLFDPEDADQLAVRLLQLASDLGLRAALVTSARRLFLERYERDTVVSGLAEHLQDATRSR
jgi:glycosyltransferase involved in cell wall biosynthesis